MIDWYTLLVPVAVLAVFLLLRFTGCSFQPGMVSQPYADDVLQDAPLVYYRLQEQPGVTTAADEMGHFNARYGVANINLLSDPALFTLPIASPSQQLGAESVQPKNPGTLSVRFNGAFVSTLGQGPIGALPRFTVDALVHPEWDIANARNFYCVFDYSNFAPGLGSPGPNRNAGFAIYAGPDNPFDPSSPICWQLWIGTGNEFARANPLDGGPGPLVSADDTYLAVLFDDTQATLYAYTMHADLDNVKFDLIRRPYQQVGGPDPTMIGLHIGISSGHSVLVPPFPGPVGFIYPFVGRIAEVAVYNTVLDQGRIISHIMNAFVTA